MSKSILLVLGVIIIIIGGYTIYSRSDTGKLNSIGKVYLTRIEPNTLAKNIILVVFPKNLPDKCLYVSVYPPFHKEDDDLHPNLDTCDVVTFEPMYAPDIYKDRQNKSYNNVYYTDILTGETNGCQSRNAIKENPLWMHIGRLKDLSQAVKYAVENPDCLSAISDYYEVIDGDVFEKPNPSDVYSRLKSHYVDVATRKPLKVYSTENLTSRWAYYQAGHWMGGEMKN